MELISKQAAIDALVAETIYTEEELREYYEANSHRNEWVNGIYEAVEAIKQLPPANSSEFPNSSDTISRTGSDPSQIAAHIIHDAIDNTTFAEEEYPGIKEQLHRSVEEWEKLQPVFTEIAEEYKKSCEISYINKPLAHALYEVWKKHDRRDTKRNE